MKLLGLYGFVVPRPSSRSLTVTLKIITLTVLYLKQFEGFSKRSNSLLIWREYETGALRRISALFDIVPTVHQDGL
jgi:hypothetical protein